MTSNQTFFHQGYKRPKISEQATRAIAIAIEEYHQNQVKNTTFDSLFSRKLV
jgi:hypothetical protein